MSNPNRPTHTATPDEIDRKWFIVDASGKRLGRIATQIAHILRGKHKPLFSPHIDMGDFVVVINAEKIELTGRKLEQKKYHRHSGYMGSIQSVTAGRLLATFPERVMEKAVKGMLPRGPLGRQMLRKLKVYAGTTHPHASQQPEPLEVRI